MKIEARQAMLFGIGLFAYGLLVYIWAERESIRQNAARIQTPRFQFALSQRDRYISEEMLNEPETETGFSDAG